MAAIPKLISDLNKGEWDVDTDYTVGDIVSRKESSYICIANDTGHKPPNLTYWTLLSKGASRPLIIAMTVALSL